MLLYSKNRRRRPLHYRSKKVSSKSIDRETGVYYGVPPESGFDSSRSYQSVNRGRRQPGNLWPCHGWFFKDEAKMSLPWRLFSTLPTDEFTPEISVSPLLFLHSYTTSSDTWTLYVATLYRRGFLGKHIWSSVDVRYTVDVCLGDSVSFPKGYNENGIFPNTE